MTTSNSFNFFVPLTLEKGGEGTQPMKIKGICSSRVEDTDGETLDPSGFDFRALMQKGFLNWDHQSKKTASAIIGEPTVARIINGGNDFYIEGFLYPDSAEARSVFELASVLEKNSPSRRLGFSIEGKAIEKDPLNPKRIKKARITGVAITPCPKNPNTLMSIMKGEYSEAFVEEYKEKSMEVNQDLTEHNPSKEKKCNCKSESCNCGLAATLKKSDIYDQIYKRYNISDVKIAKQIFTFIQTVNENHSQLCQNK